MGVDFHWISTTISSGSSHNGFGKIVSFPSVPAGFPPAGTILSTLNDVVHEIANGGATIYWFDQYALWFVAVPANTADVNIVADGTGGSYTDWANAFDIKYISGGYAGTSSSATNNTDINSNCNGVVSVSNGTKYDYVTYDGYGGFVYTNTVNSTSYGTHLFYENCDDGSGNYYDINYYSDGSGGYYSVV